MLRLLIFFKDSRVCSLIFLYFIKLSKRFVAVYILLLCSLREKPKTLNFVV